MPQSHSLTRLAAAVASVFAVSAVQAADPYQLQIGNTIPEEITEELVWNLSILPGSDQGLEITPSEGHPTLILKEGGQIVNHLSASTARIGTVFKGGAGFKQEGGTWVNHGLVTVKDGGHVSLESGGTWVNQSLGEFVLDGSTMAINPNLDATVRNNGIITLKNGAELTVGHRDAVDVDKDPSAIMLGDVTIENGTIINKSEGYLKKGALEASARTSFETLTLKGPGAVFRNTEGAVDKGTELIVKNGALAEIAGTSTWDTFTVGDSVGSLSVKETGYLELGTVKFDDISSDKLLGDVFAGSDGKVYLKGVSLGKVGSHTVTVDGNPEHVTLAGDFAVKAGTAIDRGVFTVNTTNRDEIDIPDSSSVTSGYPTEGGTIRITNFASTWSSDDLKWDTPTIGAVEQAGTGRVVFEGLRNAETEGAPDAPALSVSGIVLTEDWFKAKMDVDAASTDAQKAHYKEYLNRIVSVPTDKTRTDVTNTIDASDISIGRLTIRKTQGDANVVNATLRSSSSEDKPKTVTVEGDWQQHTRTGLVISGGSNVTVSALDQTAGFITVTDSDLVVGTVTAMGGDFSYRPSSEHVLGLGTTLTAKQIREAAGEGTDNIVYVGSPVVLTTTSNIVFGGDAVYNPDQKASKITFADDTTIVFDGRRFAGETLFTGAAEEGSKASALVEDGKTLTLKGSNLGWGVYRIFGEGTDITGEGDIAIDAGITEVWKSAVGSNVTLDRTTGELIVGGRTLEGSGINVNAINMANSIVTGNRSGQYTDQILIGSYLNMVGSDVTLADISNGINSMTGVGAVSGTIPIMIELSTFTSDQIEQHAALLSYEHGWWAQPVYSRLKSDDMRVGHMKSGYKMNAAGIMGGVDTKVDRVGTFGMGASYIGGDAETQGDALPAKTDIKSYGAHFWAVREVNDLRWIGMLSFSKSKGDTSMGTLLGTMTAETESSAMTAGLRLDTVKQYGPVKFTPHAGMKLMKIENKDYTIGITQKGRSFDAFDVKEEKATIFEIPLGITASGSFEYEQWNIRPYVDVTLRGRFGDTESTYTVSGEGYRAAGIAPDSIKYDIAGKYTGDMTFGWLSTYRNLNLGVSATLSAGDGGRSHQRIEAVMRVDL